MSVQVPKGYKQTEVGVIPKDWEVLPLRVLSERIMVGIASAATHAYRAQGVVMFRNQNIKPGFLDDSDLLFISDDYEEKFKNKRLKAFDLLTARTGYPGTTSIVPEEYEGAQSFTTLITRPKKTINHLYLCYFINSEKGQKFFEQNQIGGGQKNVNAATLKLFPVVLPSSADEQQAIAEALSDADALIESLEQLIAKKRQIKQGAMQELLTGQRRLPGFSGEWEVKSLEVIADIDPEQLNSKTFPDYEFKYISLEDVDFGSLVSHSLQIFSSAPSRARRKLKKNDILVSTVRPNLKSHLWFKNDGADWICSTGFSVIRCHEGVANPGYVFSHLFAENVNKQIDALLTGSNYPAINSRDVRQLEIPLPEFDEQVAISCILNDLELEVVALESRLDKARQIKQAMMQELLTGRIRLI